MKLNLKVKADCLAGALLLSFGALLAVPATQAAPLVYQSRDLVLCFRKTGNTGGTVGAYALEVNVGQASNYIAAAAGKVITVNQFTPAQINAVFDNLNNLSWSVSGVVQRLDGGDAAYPFYTLWTTVPRSALDAVPTLWQRASQASQGGPGSKIISIGTNARTYSGLQPADATYNTASAVRIPVGNGQDYGTFMGPGGDYASTFQGNVETTTPSDFTTAGSVSRGDLCQLIPSSTGGPGESLGYFELHPDGTLTFVRAGGTTPPPPPAPSLSLARTNGVATISFATTNGATYSLRFTNAAGLLAPVSAWPVAPGTVTGDGSVKSVTDTSPDETRFYRIEAR